MMNEYYDRYSSFRNNGNIEIVPFIEIDRADTDIMITYDRKTMRMDTLSYKYYGDANYGWLIMQANPQYGSMEFSIPDGVSLRIPYPLSTAKSRYEKGIQAYKTENGLD